jgi:parallel beta-helix repeat protein
MATVSGFEAGVVIDGGSANTVQNLIVRDNIGRDDAFNAELGDGIVVFDSPFNRIIGNTVVGNGIFDGIGVLGSDSDGNQIEGNTVESTIGPSRGGPAGQGIIVNGTGGFNTETISDTRVIDNVIRKNSSAGSANISSIGAAILRNTIEDNGLINASGNGIGVQLGARATVSGGNLIQDNEVHGNGLSGILLEKGSRENRVIDNDAANNNSLHQLFRSYDLHDRNPGCDSNVWNGNVWGDGLFQPECVTINGSGPPLPPPVPEGPFGDLSCRDGFDNDQDGLIDFQDTDCLPRTEGPPGARTCGDGFDNDGDGLVDRQDPDCGPPPEGPAGDQTCTDGVDNDDDGLVDSEDPDCDPGPTGPPVPFEGRPGTAACSDGIDNDRDGLIDGDDPDCRAPSP